MLIFSFADLFMIYLELVLLWVMMGPLDSNACLVFSLSGCCDLLCNLWLLLKLIVFLLLIEASL